MGTESKRDLAAQEAVEDSKPFSLVSVWEIFKEVDIQLQRYYHFMPSFEGKFSGFDVYYLETSFGIEGLEVPSGHQHWAKLTHNNKKEYEMFNDRLKRVLLEMSANEAHHKAISTIFTALLGRIGDTKSELFMQAYARADETHLWRSLEGKSESHITIPHISWFPERLRSLDARSLLTIFPDAEADILMMVLGKSMVGRNGLETREGTIDHSARAYAIMVDEVGGLGKSTLMNYVRGVMSKLGYKVTSVNVNMSKYGWGAIAKSDLALIDDLENEKLGDIISSHQIKSLITNALIRVEEKGCPAIEIQSETTVLGASNTTDPRHLFKMDGGSRSRLNQLQAYTPSELADKYDRNYREMATKEYWNEVAAKYDVSVELLTAYLLVRSAEKFMDAIGVKIVDGVIEKSEDTLMATMEQLRANLRIPVDVTYTDDFLKAIGNHVAFEFYSDNKLTPEQVKDRLKNLELTPELILEYIEACKFKYDDHVVERALKPKTVKLGYVLHKIDEFKRQYKVNTYAKSIENILAELQSDTGFPFPRSLSFYLQGWRRNTSDCYNFYLDLVKREASSSVKRTT